MYLPPLCPHANYTHKCNSVHIPTVEKECEGTGKKNCYHLTLFLITEWLTIFPPSSFAVYNPACKLWCGSGTSGVHTRVCNFVANSALSGLLQLSGPLLCSVMAMTLFCPFIKSGSKYYSYSW